MANTFNEWVELREYERGDLGGALQKGSPTALGMAAKEDLRGRARREAQALAGMLKAIETIAETHPRRVMRIITLMNQSLESDPALQKVLARAKAVIPQMARRAAADPQPGSPTAQPGYGGQGSMLSQG